MTRPIKVLAIVTAMETGGLELYLLNVLRHLDRHNFEVSIVCTGRDSNWYKEELDELGVEIFYCHNSYFQVGYIYKIIKLLKKFKIDVVCDFRDDFSASTLLAARLVGVKSRIAMYRSVRPGYKPTLLRNIYVFVIHQITKHFSTYIVGNTKQVLDSFYPDRGSNPKYLIINNGVDLAEFARDARKSARKEFGIPSECMVIGHVGRFHKSKNHIVMLRSFAKVAAENRQVCLLLVGYGELEAIIKEEIQALGLQGKVYWAGRRTDISNMLNTMDIFFYPSIFEGLPNALLEAMACKLPIVASNIPEIAEITPEEMKKGLIDPNDIYAFSNSLVRLIRDSKQREILGRIGRQYVGKNYSIQFSVEKLSRCWMKGL